MTNLSEKVEAELEQVEQALRELPPARGMRKLSVLELAGTASLLSSFIHTYGFELDVEQLQPLLRDVRPVRARFQTEARRFVRARKREEAATALSRRRVRSK